MEGKLTLSQAKFGRGMKRRSGRRSRGAFRHPTALLGGGLSQARASAERNQAGKTLTTPRSTMFSTVGHTCCAMTIWSSPAATPTSSE